MLLPHSRQGACYQQALALAKELYHLTAGFPDGERTVLVYSLRRAAVLLCQQLAVAAVKRGKKRKKLLETCLEHCIAIDAQLELAVAAQITTRENIAEAEAALHVLYTTVTEAG